MNKIVQNIHGVKMPKDGGDNEVQVIHLCLTHVVAGPSSFRNEFEEEEEKALVGSDHELRDKFSRK